jgi:hypothetical protein
MIITLQTWKSGNLGMHEVMTKKREREREREGFVSNVRRIIFFYKVIRHKLNGESGFSDSAGAAYNNLYLF